MKRGQRQRNNIVASQSPDAGGRSVPRYRKIPDSPSNILDLLLYKADVILRRPETIRVIATLAGAIVLALVNSPEIPVEAVADLTGLGAGGSGWAGGGGY